MKKLSILVILCCLVILVGCQAKQKTYESAENITGHYELEKFNDYVDIEKVSATEIKFQASLTVTKPDKFGRAHMYYAEHGGDLSLFANQATYKTKDGCEIQVKLYKEVAVLSDNGLCVPEDSGLSFNQEFKKVADETTDWYIYDNLKSFEK